MFLVIDNYDSFVHNLARYFELAGIKTCIRRNDAVSVAEIRAMQPQALIISPGPCSPKEAGICTEAIRDLGADMPILGVCLGHQCIGEAYGAVTMRAEAPVHGKASLIHHDGMELFDALPSPMEAGRYHSLIVKPGTNSPLVITARTEDGEIMAMRHEQHPVYGVQFHPESVMTPRGMDVVRNFIAIAQAWHNDQRSAA